MRLPRRYTPRSDKIVLRCALKKIHTTTANGY